MLPFIVPRHTGHLEQMVTEQSGRDGFENSKGNGRIDKSQGEEGGAGASQ